MNVKFVVTLDRDRRVTRHACAERGMFVLDRQENPVLLVENEWALGWITDNNPRLELSATPFAAN